MAKAKKVQPVSTASTQSMNVGMRKTKLMQIGEYHGDTGLMNPRSIDPLVYLMAERAEAVFGKDVIEKCSKKIALTNSGYPRQKALCFIADRMLRKYLAEAFVAAGKREAGAELKGLPPLAQNTYIDYFMAVNKMEREAFRTPVHSAMSDLSKMVSGYQTEQPGPVCEAVISFFKVTKNQAGMEELLGDLCDLVKGRR